MESMGIGSQLKFDSSEPSDVVDVSLLFKLLLDCQLFLWIIRETLYSKDTVGRCLPYVKIIYL